MGCDSPGSSLREWYWIKGAKGNPDSAYKYSLHHILHTVSFNSIDYVITPFTSLSPGLGMHLDYDSPTVHQIEAFRQVIILYNTYSCHVN